jgi:biotin operon repressor
MESELSKNELRNRRIIKFRLLAGNKCVLCGYDKYPQLLEFHHVDPKKKKFAISSAQSWNNTRKELEKCILVCPNCHVECENNFFKVDQLENLQIKISNIEVQQLIKTLGPAGLTDRRVNPPERFLWSNKKNPGKRTGNQYPANKTRKAKMQKFRMLAGDECCVCQYSRLPAALEFHHLDPLDKIDSIANLCWRKWEVGLEEIQKCVLLCKTCHKSSEFGLIKASALKLFQIKISQTDIDKMIQETGLEGLSVEAKRKYALKNKNFNFKTKSFYCIDCKNSISRKALRCNPCNKRRERPTKINWPDVERLTEMVEQSSLSQTGQKLGVSGNAVKKRIRRELKIKNKN